MQGSPRLFLGGSVEGHQYSQHHAYPFDSRWIVCPALPCQFSLSWCHRRSRNPFYHSPRLWPVSISVQPLQSGSSLLLRKRPSSAHHAASCCCCGGCLLGPSVPAPPADKQRQNNTSFERGLVAQGSQKAGPAEAGAEGQILVQGLDPAHTATV
jgi:hypothetical protein